MTDSKYDINSTELSLWEQVRSSDEGVRNLGLQRFHEKYAPALVAYGCYLGADLNDIEDFLSEFLMRKVMVEGERNIVQAFVDAAGGRFPNAKANANEKPSGMGSQFRRWLLSVWANFLIDKFRAEQRYAACLKRFESGVSARSRSPSNRLESFWVVNLLTQAIRDTKAQYESTNPIAWQMLSIRLLQPAVTGLDPPTLAECAQRFGLSGPIVVSNRLKTGINGLIRNLSTLVNDYLEVNDVDASRMLHDELLTLADIELPSEVLQSSDLAELIGIQPAAYGAEMDSSLFISCFDPDSIWSSTQDLPAIWNAILEMPLWRYFMEARVRAEVTEKLNEHDSLETTIRELFDMDHPSSDLLRAVKRVARQEYRSQTQGPGLNLIGDLPRAVNLALYVVAICIAHHRCKQRITKYKNPKLLKRLRAVSNLSWVDDHYRESLDAWIAEIDQSPAAPELT